VANLTPRTAARWTGAARTRRSTLPPTTTGRPGVMEWIAANPVPAAAGAAVIAFLLVRLLR
jgi:hypothetical protein